MSRIQRAARWLLFAYRCTAFLGRAGLCGTALIMLPFAAAGDGFSALLVRKGRLAGRHQWACAALTTGVLMLAVCAGLCGTGGPIPSAIGTVEVGNACLRASANSSSCPAQGNTSAPVHEKAAVNSTSAKLAAAPAIVLSTHIVMEFSPGSAVRGMLQGSATFVVGLGVLVAHCAACLATYPLATAVTVGACALAVSTDL